MIYDTLDHAGQYRKLSGNLAKALDYLTGTELETVEAGRVEIDGERVFALFQSYETKPENDRPEAHRKYIDIQYLIEGEELIGVAPLASMERVAEAAPERDIWFYEGETAKLPLGGLRSSFRRTRTRRASPRASAGRCGRSCSRSPLSRRNEPKKRYEKPEPMRISHRLRFYNLFGHGVHRRGVPRAAVRTDERQFVGVLL